MSSRFLSLTAMACLLLATSTGCSQLSSRFSQETEAVQTAVEGALIQAVQAEEAPEASNGKGEAIAEVSALQRAEQSAKIAAATAGSAITDTDWNRAISQWKTAIAQAASVPPEGDRAAAQAKINEYQTQLAKAEQQYAKLVQNRYQVFSTSPVSNAGAANTHEADGKQLRAWLQAGDFAQAEALLKAAVQQKKLTRGGAYYADSVLRTALGGDDVVFSAEMMGQLNQWVEQAPNNPYAYLTRAYGTQSFIWAKPLVYRYKNGDAEGSRNGATVDGEALGKPLIFSLLDTQKALQLAPNHPLALLSDLRLARTFAIAHQDDGLVNEAFDRLEKVLPLAFESHFEKTVYLLAKDDDGSAALQFLRGQVAKVPSNSAIPILITLTHFALNNQQTNAREYLNQPEVWQEIQTHSEKVIAAFPEEGIYAGWYAYLADKAERGNIARRYAQIAMGRDAASAELQTWLQVMN